jgi:hypothetical protein
VISNSEYWIAPEIIVAKSERSKLRAFRPQLEFCRPFGRNLQARLERPELKQAVPVMKPFNLPGRALAA